MYRSTRGDFTSRKKNAKREAAAALEQGFAWVERAIKNPEAYPDFVVILPFDPAMLARIFTEERLRLWAELSRSRPDSLTELADRLGRNVSRVRQDLLILQDAHLVRTERKGNRVTAFAQAPSIIIAPPT
jgi:DNA-binding transcriptional ArsR family regulator